SSYFFFFSSRRRHTRSYGDWSSDVCSSDLLHRAGRLGLGEGAPAHRHRFGPGHVAVDDGRLHVARPVRLHPAVLREGESLELLEIGRASCRERGEVWVVGGGVKKKEGKVRC